MHLIWDRLFTWANLISISINESPHDKTNKMACAPSEDSDQLGHPPSLIRVFAVHMKKARVLSYPLRAQRILWLDWVDAKPDPCLRWVHNHFVGFVVMWLKCYLCLRNLKNWQNDYPVKQVILLPHIWLWNHRPLWAFPSRHKIP